MTEIDNYDHICDLHLCLIERLSSYSKLIAKVNKKVQKLILNETIDCGFGKQGLVELGAEIEDLKENLVEQSSVAYADVKQFIENKENDWQSTKKGLKYNQWLSDISCFIGNIESISTHVDMSVQLEFFDDEVLNTGELPVESVGDIDLAIMD